MKKLLFTLLLAAMVLPSRALDLYLIGPATLHEGYPYVNRDKTYMVESSDAYTWIGKLTTGNFKIAKGQGSWVCYHPAGESNLDITNANLGSDLELVDRDSDDPQWNITEEGTYKLTINKNNFGNPSTLKIEKFTQSLSQDDDDYYLLGTAAQLAEFAHLISHNVLPLNSKAKLTEDVDFDDVGYFVPIGNNDYRYQGEFDGQGHKISNLNINISLSNIGVFGAIAEGATIKNFILDNTCSIYGGSSVGIIGKSQLVNDVDGTITLSGIGNEANVGGSGKNVAGILGVNVWSDGTNHYTKLQMTNCYSIGNITGGYDQDECGQLTGWSGDNAVLTNCYISGTVTRCWPFGRFGSSTVINCYYFGDYTLSTSAPYTSLIEVSSLNTGELCYLLNGSTCYDVNWTQTIGEDSHPIPFNTHGIVNKISSVGYTTQYIPSTDVTIPANVEAYAGVINGNWLSLRKIEGAIFKNDAVILKGSEGYYSFVPTTGASEAASNALLGSDGDVTGDGTSYYALSTLGGTEPIGFYLVNSGVTIPAGKAYLNTGAGVKGFTFVFDDDATSIEMVNGQSSMVNDNEIYNLAGQRINKMQKGINIVNGKKIMK